MEPRNKRKKILLLLFADAILLCLWFFAKQIASFMANTLSNCLFAQMGFLCPACGGTRCFAAFCSGNFAQALALNPYFFFLFIYVILTLFVLHLSVLFSHKHITKALEIMTHYKLVIVLAIGFALFGILRNFI